MLGSKRCDGQDGFAMPLFSVGETTESEGIDGTGYQRQRPHSHRLARSPRSDPSDILGIDRSRSFLTERPPTLR